MSDLEGKLFGLDVRADRETPKEPV
jgi:hypothetical protein